LKNDETYIYLYIISLSEFFGEWCSHSFAPFVGGRCEVSLPLFSSRRSDSYTTKPKTKNQTKTTTCYTNCGFVVSHSDMCSCFGANKYDSCKKKDNSPRLYFIMELWVVRMSDENEVLVKGQRLNVLNGPKSSFRRNLAVKCVDAWIGSLSGFTHQLTFLYIYTHIFFKYIFLFAILS
jgi:hypothetical protein